MTLRIVELDGTLEHEFLRYIKRDRLGYFFFITDFEKERESSRFLLAMDGRRIVGVLLLYKDRIAQPRGSARAVRALIRRIDIDVVEGMVELRHGKSIVAPLKPTYVAEMDLLHLKKGRERLFDARLPKRLKDGDARSVAALMREADPRLWGGQTASSVRGSMKMGVWVGVKEKGHIAAIGMARTYDHAGMIHTIATAERARNRGFATANVSALLGHIFQRSDDALINVMRHNGPAYRAYTKVGFRVYKRFLYFRCRKG